MKYQITDFHSLQWSDLDENMIDGMIKFEHIHEYLPYTLSLFERPDVFHDCLSGKYGDIAKISDHRRSVIENQTNEVVLENPSDELKESMDFSDSINQEASTGSNRGYVMHIGAILELASERTLKKLDDLGCVEDKEHKKAIQKIRKGEHVSFGFKIKIFENLNNPDVLTKLELELLNSIKEIRNIAAHSFKFDLGVPCLADNLKILFDKVDLNQDYIFEKVKADFSLLLKVAYGISCYKIRDRLLTYSYGRNVLDELNGKL